MLANELDKYKEKGNRYIDDNIWEIQDLYIGKDNKGENGIIEDKEVILVKPYEVSTTTTTSRTSFIMDEVKNLFKYMKFI